MSSPYEPDPDFTPVAFNGCTVPHVETPFVHLPSNQDVYASIWHPGLSRNQSKLDRLEQSYAKRRRLNDGIFTTYGVWIEWLETQVNPDGRRFPYGFISYDTRTRDLHVRRAVAMDVARVFADRYGSCLVSEEQTATGNAEPPPDPNSFAGMMHGVRRAVAEKHNVSTIVSCDPVKHLNAARIESIAWHDEIPIDIRRQLMTTFPMMTYDQYVDALATLDPPNAG